MHRRFILLSFASLATLAAAFVPAAVSRSFAAPATEAVTVGAGVQLTVSSLQARLRQLEKGEAEDEGARAEAVRDYGAAIRSLETAAEWSRRGDALERLQSDRPQILEKTRAETESWAGRTPEPVPDSARLADVEGALAEVDATLAATRSAVSELDAELKRLAERRLLIPGEIAQAGSARRAAFGELELPALPLGSDDRALARRASELAQERSTGAQVEALELERTTSEVRRELLSARRDLLRRKRDALAARQSVLQEALAERRAEAAEKAAEDARANRESLARVDPALGALAEENTSLTERRAGPEGLTARIEAATRHAADVDETLRAVRARSAAMRERVEAAGLSDTVGLLLRKERSELPDIQRARGDIRARRSEISDAQLQALAFDDQRAAMPAVEAEVAAIVPERAAELDAAARTKLDSSVRSLLRVRRESLDALVRDYNAYFSILVDLDAKERELVAEVEDYAAFLDQHVLWIPNTRLPGLGFIAAWPSAIAWLADPTHYGAALQRLRAAAGFAPLQTTAFGLLLLLTLVYRGRMRRIHREVCASRRPPPALPSMPAPLVAVLLGVVLAASAPFLLWVLGNMLATAPSPPDEFSLALAAALKDVALPLFVLELVRRAARRDGLASVFLGWPEASLATIRSQMLVLLAVALPAWGFASFFEAQPVAEWSDAIGRAAFVVTAVTLGVVGYRLLTPDGKVLKHAMRVADLGSIGPVLSRAHMLALAVSLAIALMAVFGYHYTAMVLLPRLWLTGIFLAAFVVASAILHRWLVEARRRAADAARADAEDEQAAGDPPIAVTEAELAGVGAQTRTLLRGTFGIALVVAIFVTWADAFPAIRFLERVELWSVTATLESVVGSGDAARTETVSTLVPVTAANVLLALVAVVLAVFGARNLPGLLELVVLSRTSLDHGLRYAIATVSRYIITIAGVIVVFRNLGIDWSSVQWLVAAVSVGLGFGLQEIFGNFVSGLILLFERPVRVGDTVTLGGVTGTVSRIRMRATTIVDFDRKELIVPNKEFITGQLVNWSLTDPTLRLVIPVGVAYGSDTASVERLLHEAAKQCATTLENPPPQVVFLNFGDSSLDFELRVFIAGMGDLVATRHSLMMEIDRKFRAAGIEIPFPQRDLHVRSVDAGAVEAVAAARRASKGDSGAATGGGGDRDDAN